MGYYDDEDALELCRRANASDKVKILAGICAAPGILGKAGILKDKRATAHAGVKERVEPLFGEYTGEDVTVDGKIITANGPPAAKAFGEKILSMLK
jgi:protease I